MSISQFTLSGLSASTLSVYLSGHTVRLICLNSLCLSLNSLCLSLRSHCQAYLPLLSVYLRSHCQAYLPQLCVSISQVSLSGLSASTLCVYLSGHTVRRICLNSLCLSLNSLCLSLRSHCQAYLPLHSLYLRSHCQAYLPQLCVSISQVSLSGLSASTLCLYLLGLTVRLICLNSLSLSLRSHCQAYLPQLSVSISQLSVSISQVTLSGLSASTLCLSQVSLSGLSASTLCVYL